MFLEPSDSQLSDLMKQSNTQENEGNLTQELSQNTFQRIMDSVCQDSPIMSQGTFNAVVADIKTTPALRREYDVLCNSGQNENDRREDSFLPFSPPKEQPGLKKEKTRTPRISDSPTLPIINAFDMNPPKDLFYDTEDSALLNQSIVSNTTFSQIQCGSQPYEYLRERTKEEQELRNQNRLAQKLLIKEKQLKRESEAIAFTGVMTQQVNMDFHNDVDNIFDNIEEPMEEEQWMTVNVNVKDATKMSDLAAENTEDDGKHLWARKDCRVPIEVKWKVNHCNRELFLRLRFVSYKSNTNIENAIRDPNADAVKCLTHINSESRTPIESFFYVVNSARNWYSDQTLADRGHSFVTKLQPGATELSFDIMFMCQKICMSLDERRKFQCFAVFLEDENGNELLYDKIDKVYVIGYPRRDWKLYSEKRSDFTFSETSSFRTSKKTKITSPSTQKMSATRKRAASEFVPFVNMGSPSSTSASYSMRIHGCQPKLEDMDYETMENAPSTSRKRLKTIHYPHKNITLSEKEYTKVVEFLAKSAKEDLSKITSSQFFERYSDSLNTIAPSDGIDKFLALLGENNEEERFRNLGVHKMSDLSKIFEKRSDVFESLGVDFSKLEQYYDMFLIFHRMQGNNKQSENDEMI